VVTAPTAALAGVPKIVSSVRNMSEWKGWRKDGRWWYRQADRLAAPLNDLIVGNSQAVVDDFRRWSNAEGVRYLVVPNAIDCSEYERQAVRNRSEVRSSLRIDPATTILLSVGRLAHEKNHAMLLRCCLKLRELGHDYRLIIVGHGDLELELRAQARKLGIEDLVVFAGRSHLPQEYYIASDVFVQTSLIEGMPNVLLEAHLCGLPVVTTDAGGSREVVQDEVTGFVVPIDDDIGFVERVARLVSDGKLRETMGMRGRKRILDFFGIENLQRRIDRITERNPN
jgi:glycosyltransferase involved in cell wall biosynthesis